MSYGLCAIAIHRIAAIRLCYCIISIYVARLTCFFVWDASPRLLYLLISKYTILSHVLMQFCLLASHSIAWFSESERQSNLWSGYTWFFIWKWWKFFARNNFLIILSSASVVLCFPLVQMIFFCVFIFWSFFYGFGGFFLLFVCWLVYLWGVISWTMFSRCWLPHHTKAVVPSHF